MQGNIRKRQPKTPLHLFRCALVPDRHLTTSRYLSARCPTGLLPNRRRLAKRPDASGVASALTILRQPFAKVKIPPNLRVRYGRDAVTLMWSIMLARMAMGLLCSLAAMMQGSTDYPARPVRIIEPFGTGGGPDLISRAIGPKLTELWGQPVTAENHPGAGSTAAPALVAKSPADGYALLVNTNAQPYSAALLKNLPYDPLNDFIPVAPLTRANPICWWQAHRQALPRSAISLLQRRRSRVS